MRFHAGTNQGHLAHLIVVKHLRPVTFAAQLRQDLHRPWAVFTRAGKGDVSDAIFHGGDILQHHIDVDLGIRDGTEHFGSLARLIWNTQHGHLGFGLIGGNTSQYCIFHWDILH